ncbi:MAG: AAC(3) family N-acetyltransferase, partial [Planctomycetes bacterium]|nr:AAC(3) family N-acetyltransferase [Planctomycetota bacterium]
MVTRKEIARDLRRLGLRRGDIVELHSSLKSIGRVRGGPKTVIHAFQDVLGTAGTLLMPAFTYCLEGRGSAFHPQRSSVRTGLVCETFWRMKGVVRSICPVHSVAAWGKRAEEFTRRHPLTSTLGVDSPFHLAARAGGKVILLGCGHKSNSFLHVVESLTLHPMLYEVAPSAPHALLDWHA